MLRAFFDGRELVFFGMTEAGRSSSARLLAFDLSSRQARELVPGLRIQRGSNWSPLEVSRDGQSVYALSDMSSTRMLLQIPRRGGKPPTALMSFPVTASPVSLDAPGDGSLYIDQLLSPHVSLRFSAAGGAPEEFALPPNLGSIVGPGGDVLITLPNWGKQRLAAIRPGGEPRVLVETSEESSLPATIFNGYVALMIGTGDQQRIALASLRDGRILRRFGTRADNGMSASPDGKTLYYSFAGAVWAQPVADGEPKRITEGVDVVLDPAGRYLYVKRSRKGTLAMFRLPVAGGDAEELPVPPQYHVANPPLSPAAVDARGRILVSVVSDAFYYRTAMLDPADKSFRPVPVAIDGDSFSAGWAPDGRIVCLGQRYMMSLWRYQRSKAGN